MTTASSVPPAAAQIQTKLQELLERASLLKESTDIEPPLQTSSLEPQIQELPSFTSNGDAQLAFEVAARTLLYTLVSQDPLTSPLSVSVWNLLDITQTAASLGIAHGSCLLRLIEELFDTQTLAGCRRLFEYLESRRVKLLKSGDGFTSEKSQIVLRMMNELLRRLSRSEDAVLSGRVYVFLFQSFPLGDKSSVNLRGEFHTENVTTYDEDVGKDVDEKMEDADEKKDSDTKDKKEDKAKEDDIDPMKLYPIFWSLQQAFANPLSLFSEPALSSFKSALELTVKKFKSTVQPTTRTTVTKTSLEDSASSPSRKRKREDRSLISPTAPSTTMAQSHNTKYLTAPSLFPLELADLAFHRHIALQSLITLDFLLSLTPRAKTRLTTLEPRTKQQKPLAFPSFTLGPEDEKWCTAMRRQIENYIRSSKDGVYFYRMVDNVLRRDVNWARWKAVSCPSIELPPLATSAVLEARRGAKERVAWKRLRPHAMGSLDLEFLSTTLTPQEGEVLPGVRKSGASLAASTPSDDTLISDVQNLDMDIDFLLPREGESFPDRFADLDRREKEADVKSKPSLREERLSLKKERQAWLKEKSEIQSRRATQTWRLLRGVARREFGLLKEVKENTDVTLCSAEKMSEWRVQRGQKLSAAAAKGSAETSGDGDGDGVEAEAEAEAEGTPAVGDEAQTENKEKEEGDGDGDGEGQAVAHVTDGSGGAEVEDEEKEKQTDMQIDSQPEAEAEEKPQAIQVVDMQDAD